MIRPKGLIRSGLTALVAAVVFPMAASVSHACDTPVYRYAMYRWFPAPYEVYLFHEGEMGESGAQMKAAVDKAGESADAPTNIVFIPVDLLTDEDLTGVPPDVKETWQKQEKPTLPRFLISSPVGAHLLFGSLATKDLPTIIHSPMRQQTGKLLEAGKAGIYILLEGEDDEANAAAEKVLRGVVDDVAAGKVSLYSMPAFGGWLGNEEADEKEGQEAEPSPLSVGLLTVARDNAKEKWLVDCLLALEPDLRASKEPIVFMVYGRGRALFSCLGKGIHRDNLIQDIEFITGACSCTVKEQNPGVDLLMCYDWDAAAEALSRQYGTEEGSRYDFSGDALFPELIIPPEGNDAAGERADTTTSSSSDADVEAEVDESLAGGDADSDDSINTPGRGTKVAALTRPEHAAESRGDSNSDAPASSLRGILWVGAGLFIALVALFGATFVVLRPK